MEQEVVDSYDRLHLEGTWHINKKNTDLCVLSNSKNIWKTKNLTKTVNMLFHIIIKNHLPIPVV